MPDNVFGIPDAPPEDVLGLIEPDPEITPEGDVENVTEDTPSAEEEIVEEAVETEEEAPEVEEAPEALPAEEESEVQETPEEEAQRLWANKYQSPEELERGYNESREQWRRAVEARKAEEQRALELETQYSQLQQALQQVVPTLQQAAEREKLYQAWAADYRSQTGEFPPGYQPLAEQTPQAVAPEQVQAIVEQRIAQERAMAYEAAQRQQELKALEQNIYSFYQDHPEVEPRGTLDNEITDTIAALNEAWVPTNTEVDPSDRGSLEIAYEAATRPALLAVLQMKPQYFESDYGMRLARMEASVLEGAPPSTEPKTRRMAASQAGQTAGQKKPYTESASAGATAPAEDDGSDPWAEIVKSVQGGKKGSNVFFE